LESSANSVRSSLLNFSENRFLHLYRRELAGRSAVIGVALVDKKVQEAGVIKTMCFAGLYAIHGGGDFKTVFANMREISAHAECLESPLRAVEQSVGNVS
jgi:hypothetical protein